jgi:hypothetical protein
MTMTRAIALFGLAFWLASSSGAAFASSESSLQPLKSWASAGSVVQQRIDTEEVTLPPPPTGPATPIPFCSPGTPLCP